MNQPGGWLWKLRFCWGSHPRTTVKNELGTHEFPCPSVGATPYWGKGQRVKKYVYMYVYIYPIGTLPEHLHSTITSYTKTTRKHTNPKETRFLPSLTLVTLLANHPLPLLTPSLGASPSPTQSSHSKFWRHRSRLCSCAALYFVRSLCP